MKIKLNINAHILLSLCIIGLIFPTSIYTMLVYILTSAYFIISCIGLILMCISSCTILMELNSKCITTVKHKIQNNTITTGEIDEFKMITEQLNAGIEVLMKLFTNFKSHITFAMSTVIIVIAYISNHELRVLHITLATYLFLCLIVRFIFLSLLIKLSDKLVGIKFNS